MIHRQIKRYGIVLSFVVLNLVQIQTTYSQEVAEELDATSAYHNQLFFNRFFINPTFSLVRENKSYLNILHRNQYTSFEDNRQNYFLGFSNKLNENTALGLGVYSQWAGVVQEFGVNANYATAVKLGDNSSLTFGTNLSYYTEGLDKNRIVVISEDSQLNDATKESKLTIQPGITLSLGNFDFGLYATDLFKYNQTTNAFLTNLSEKSIQGTMQYTHTFNTHKGFLENARLMPLVQFGKNNANEFSYVGSLLIDLPKYGWLQTNYASTNSMSFGLGFNLSKKMSLGYLLEKDLSLNDTDLGWNHEISMAYTFSKTERSEEWAENSTHERIDEIVQYYEEQIAELTAKQNRTPEEEIRKTKLTMNTLAHENRLILDQLILRQDSIETHRTAASEKRFKMIINAVRSDIKNNNESNLNLNRTSTSLASNYSKTKQGNINVNLKKTSKSLLASTNPKPNSIQVNADQNKTNTPSLTSNNPKANSIKAKEGQNKINTPSLTSNNPITNSIKANADQNKTNTPSLTSNNPKTNSIKAKEDQNKINTPSLTSNYSKTNKKSLKKQRDFKEIPIKMLKQSDIVGAQSGYYVIANVFKNKKYLNSFMKSLTKKGLNAKEFYNKENGLHYVYLANYDYKQDAKTACISNLKGKYQNEKWIMEVANTSTIVHNSYEN